MIGATGAKSFKEAVRMTAEVSLSRALSLCEAVCMPAEVRVCISLSLSRARSLSLSLSLPLYM